MSSSSEFRAGVDTVERRAGGAEVRPARILQSLAVSVVSPERAREEARAEGFSVGWAEGHRAAAEAAADEAVRVRAEEHARRTSDTARLEAALSALERAGSDLSRRAAPSVQEACELIAAAAYDVAVAVIGRELATSGEPALDAIRRALTGAPERTSSVVVRLCPQDVLTLQSLPGEVLEIEGRTVGVLSDPALRSGDAVAECDSTTLDARIAPALARVKEILSP